MAQESTNTQIADVLERIADLLEAQQENPFRIRAYREGASTVRNYDQPIAEFIHKKRFDELIALPRIGEGIASVIGEYVTDGKSSLLEELEAQASPEDAFARVPGIGKELAQRMIKELHIQTLPELEEAAHDGRLEKVEGFGAKRVEGVRSALAGMLSRSARKSQRNRVAKAKDETPDDRPSVDLILEIDEQYRKRAQAGDLPKIAPKRFNPDHQAWLPVMDIKRDGWSFTALFSNTAKAHELEKTDDWVVIYYEKGGKERQNTVVTETQGSLKGKRVVRGREAENRQFYGGE